MFMFLQLYPLACNKLSLRRAFRCYHFTGAAETGSPLAIA